MLQFQFHQMVLATAFVCLGSVTVRAGTVTVDFEDYPLASESNFHGPTTNGYLTTGQWGDQIRVGTFNSGGVEFVNSYNYDFGSWSSFAVSNETNTTTPGFTNQFSVYAGSGAGGSANFGVGFGYDDVNPNLFDPDPFDPTSVDDLQGLPTLYLPDGHSIISAMVTNTTYTALSMLYGDDFAKQFGGISGDDEDYLLLSAYGIDANGQALEAGVELYLADYRFANNSLDYILTDWVSWDLSPLAGAVSLHFNLESSDVGDYGMNTPAYFAMDNLVLEYADQPVPEPSTLALLASGGICLGAMRLRRRRNWGARKTGSTT